MKKIVAVFVILLCCVLSFNIGKLVVAEMQQKAIDNAIDNDKYTQEEYINFQNQLINKEFYYYNNLTEIQKEAYITLYYSALNFDESCKVKIPTDELRKIIYAIIYDNSNIFWLSGNYTYYEYEDYIELVPEYTCEKKEANRIIEKLQKKINEIVSQIPIGSTDYEKELFLHDYICKNTVYDEMTYKNGGDTAHSSLLNGKSICEGYARAMQILLDTVGIDNYLIVGDGTNDGKTEPHMWNIVEIDGYNYHLDVTWNDGINEKMGGYFYFNVPDSYILRDHSNLNPLQNNCVSNSANYFKMQNTYIEVFVGFNSLVTPTAEILKTGKNEVGFLFKNKSDYNLALQQMNDNSRLFNYVSDSVWLSGRRLSKNNIEYYSSDEYFYLCISFLEE